MTVREMLLALQTLPRDAELLAFEAGCEDYCERKVVGRRFGVVGGSWHSNRIRNHRLVDLRHADYRHLNSEQETLSRFPDVCGASPSAVLPGQVQCAVRLIPSRPAEWRVVE